MHRVPTSRPDARTARRDVGYEGEVFTTAASGSGDGAFTDEEYMFRIDHYYGAAPLSFKVYDQGWLGRTLVGECDLISADVLHDQLDRLQSLGVELSTNAVGELAINTNRFASSVTRAQSDADPLTHPQWKGWFVPGANPCAQVRPVSLHHPLHADSPDRSLTAARPPRADPPPDGVQQGVAGGRADGGGGVSAATGQGRHRAAGDEAAAQVGRGSSCCSLRGRVRGAGRVAATRVRGCA